jgi:16S rRNA (uracil1498-N3)-methyltransferase
MSDATEAARDTNHELRLILWENERTCFLKTALSKSDKPATAIVAIGPEGGFTLEEVQIFSRSGFQPVSLGARILRTETAALAILAIMQYMWDEL